MILQDIIVLVSNTLKIKADDTSVQEIIKNVSNEAYTMLCSVDKRISRSYVPIVNGIATLPENFLGVLKCTPSLDIKDKFYGKSIVTDKEGILEVLYFYARDLLVEDEDELDLHITLQQALINYVCYIICNSEEKVQQAESFYNAYARNVNQFENIEIENIIADTVVEVEY